MGHVPCGAQLVHLRFVLDLADDATLTWDERLQRFIVRAAPELSPVWKGQEINTAWLARLAQNSIKGDAGALATLNELYERAVLSHLGRAEWSSAQQRWRAAVTDYQAGWEMW